MSFFPYIEVKGSSYEMGHQHGAQTSSLVHKYLVWIEKMTSKSRDLLAANAVAFLPYMERLSPRFVEEVRGLADGAGISFEEALLAQCRGEAARASASEGCTAFALTGEATEGGHPLAGQNQDLTAEFGDLGIVLHVKPDDDRPRAIIFTFAGQLGYMGMNQRGVAHFANGLGDFEWRPGLPHYPLKRFLLELPDVACCLRALEEHRTCSAGNMVFCDGDGAVADVEIRPEGIAVYRDQHPDCRLHTNHYLTPEFAPYETHATVDSRLRLERLRHLVDERWGEITADVMKDLLADHHGDPAAICRHGAKGWHSVAGYIAEPAAGLFHVRRGHGCTGTWTAYEV
jgi:hypothetical protein